MMKDDQKKLVDVMMSFMDEFVQRYYVCDPPVIKKSDNIDLGYRQPSQRELKGHQTKKKQSINLAFQTTQPSRKEIEGWLKVWVQTQEL